MVTVYEQFVLLYGEFDGVCGGVEDGAQKLGKPRCDGRGGAADFRA
jgi:hypothetical protein